MIKIGNIIVIFITSFILTNCVGEETSSVETSSVGEETSSVGEETSSVGEETSSVETSVSNAATEYYGFRLSMPYCIQGIDSVSCDLVVENISEEDQTFHLGINPLLIDEYGYEYTNVNISSNGSLLYEGGSGGWSLRLLVLKEIPRVYTIKFLGIDTSIQRTYIPRFISDWTDAGCFTCPEIVISNIEFIIGA